jgi:hypothetical protein
MIGLFRLKIGPCLYVQLIGLSGRRRLAYQVQCKIIHRDFIDSRTAEISILLDFEGGSVRFIHHGAGGRLERFAAFSNAGFLRRPHEDFFLRHRLLKKFDQLFRRNQWNVVKRKGIQHGFDRPNLGGVRC